MKSRFKKRIICITGSSGNLGRHFCKQYFKKYVIKKYPYRIENTNYFKKWIKKNKANTFLRELVELAQKYEHTKSLSEFYLCSNFPVDVRHNIKIDRKLLSEMKLQSLG